MSIQKTPAIVGLIGLSVALVGCGRHQPSAQPPTTATTVPPAVTTKPAPPVTSGTTGRTRVVVYTVDTALGTEADNYLVPRPIPLKKVQDPAREALKALLNAPGTPIPAGTALNSVKIADGLATVDFSRSPVDQTHGEEKQAQALEAIQRTLGQFPEIERIQINVNGQAPASLGEAAGGPMDVIRPGDKVREAGGA